jgi:hypothetical protein
MHQDATKYCGNNDEWVCKMISLFLLDKAIEANPKEHL